MKARISPVAWSPRCGQRGQAAPQEHDVETGVLAGKETKPLADICSWKPRYPVRNTLEAAADTGVRCRRQTVSSR